MPKLPRVYFKPVFIALIAAFSVSTLATADGDKRTPRVPLLPKYQQECAACHAAFPPGMLPASSWRRVMDNLKQHYGTDASLDAAATAELSGWLVANAGT